MRRSLLALSAALALGGCGSTVVNPVSGQAERSAMSLSQEVAAGRQGHQEVLKEYGALANPALQAYVSALGKKLAAQSHRPELDWQFTVLDSPEINAFALPGGYVYVTRGILAYLDSEADLAGVMGHEIGHVTARHGAQRATRQQTAGLGVLAATVLGAVLEAKGVGGATEMAGQVSQGVAAGLIASYSRDQELQADQLGAEYLARNRYSPQHMVDVIQVLKDQERFAADQARAQGRPQPEGRGWLASHPSNDERLQRIRDEALQYPIHGSEDAGRERYLQAIQGLEFGDSPAQGLVRGQVFVHPGLDLALTAPAGWSLHNSAEQLTLVNASRDAALTLQAVPARAGTRHEDILSRWVGADQGRSDARRINGLAATHFIGTRRNAQGQRSAIELTLVSTSQGAVYALIVAGQPQALQHARSELQQATDSFRPLNAQDRQLAKPWRLALRPLPPRGFAELAKGSVLSEAQLRLLNGQYSQPGGEGQALRPGTRVKTVVAAP
jgi:predicted Zn-dependent protease